MKLEEWWQKYGMEANREERRALNELHDFFMVGMREAAEAGKPFDQGRFKRLQAKVEETRKKVRKVEELLSEVED